MRGRFWYAVRILFVVVCSAFIHATISPLWWLQWVPSPILLRVYGTHFFDSDALYVAVVERLAYPDRWVRDREIGPYVLRGNVRVHLHDFVACQDYPPGSDVWARARLVDYREWDEVIRAFDIAYEVRPVGCSQSVWFSSFEHFGDDVLIAVPGTRCESGVVDLDVTEYLLLPFSPKYRTGVAIRSGTIVSRYRMQVVVPEWVKYQNPNSWSQELSTDLRVWAMWKPDSRVTSLKVNLGSAAGELATDLTAAWTVDILADDEVICQGRLMWSGEVGVDGAELQVPMYQQAEISSLPGPESVRIRVRSEPVNVPGTSQRDSQAVDLEVEFGLTRDLRRDPVYEHLWWHGLWIGEARGVAVIFRRDSGGEAH